MKIGLFGATGQIGRPLLDRLLTDGHHVTALLRDPDKIAPQDGLIRLHGDAAEEAALITVLDESEAVISVMNMPDPAVASTVFSENMDLLITKMERRGPKRLLFVATAGVLPHAEGGLRGDRFMPPFLANAYAEHRRNWVRIEHSPLDWTVLCPTGFSEGEAEPYQVAADDMPDGVKESPVRASVDFLAHEVVDGKFIRKRVGIGR